MLPFENETASYPLPEDIIRMAYPWDSELSTWSSCKRLDINSTDGNANPTNQSVDCEGSWVYDNSMYESSTVIEVILKMILLKSI